MFNINGYEALVLAVISLVVIGPQRLPEYAASLGKWVRQARDYAQGAKEQIKDEMGPDFDQVDWRSLDPRQYDPRRIVREALADPAPDHMAPLSSPAGEPVPLMTPSRPAEQRPAPFDSEAT